VIASKARISLSAAENAGKFWHAACIAGRRGIEPLAS
jgi:hypothetical protein